MADPRQMDAAMRSQLGEISAASQLLLRGAGERDKRYLGIISRAAFRCGRIIHEGELARRLDDEDALHAEFATMDLADWCGKAARHARELLAAAGIELTFTCRENSLLTLADQELLDELLYELVSNAAKAAGKGGRIDVTLARRGGNAILTVGDTGAGFPESALARLVGDAPLEPDLTPGTGAGLGLRLCRAIVETHGGLLMLESGPGAGTRCAASLPLREGQREALASPLSADGFDRARAALSDVLPPESFYPDA